MDTAISLSSRSLQFYLIARHWASDLEFFRFEVSFLQNLLKEYTLHLSDTTHRKLAAKKLLKLEKESHETDALLTEQLQQLQLMAEDVIPENTEELAGKQVQLEYLMSNFTKEYRALKLEIFGLIEGIINTK